MKDSSKPKRKSKREQQLTRHSNWKTTEFGDEVKGPGMKSGPIVPIGSAAEQGAWERAKEGKSEHREGFIGVTRKMVRGDCSSHHSSSHYAKKKKDSGSSHQSSSHSSKKTRDPGSSHHSSSHSSKKTQLDDDDDDDDDADEFA
jgi:hypothetical protein